MLLNYYGLIKNILIINLKVSVFSFYICKVIIFMPSSACFIFQQSHKNYVDSLETWTSQVTRLWSWSRCGLFAQYLFQVIVLLNPGLNFCRSFVLYWVDRITPGTQSFVFRILNVLGPVELVITQFANQVSRKSIPQIIKVFQ